MATTTVKVTSPPGSGRLAGSGVLMTLIAGRTSVMKTRAGSVSVSALPSSSLAVAVTTSRWRSPALPKNSPSNEQS